MLLSPEISNLRPDEVGKLTDREAWEWYLKPASERAERTRAAREGGSPGWEPKTGAETLDYLRKLGVKGVPEKEKT